MFECWFENYSFIFFHNKNLINNVKYWWHYPVDFSLISLKYLFIYSYELFINQINLIFVFFLWKKKKTYSSICKSSLFFFFYFGHFIQVKYLFLKHEKSFVGVSSFIFFFIITITHRIRFSHRNDLFVTVTQILLFTISILHFFFFVSSLFFFFCSIYIVLTLTGNDIQDRRYCKWKIFSDIAVVVLNQWCSGRKYTIFLFACAAF